jgi:KipI family sensor histidine kinase inhibitor
MTTCATQTLYSTVPFGASATLTTVKDAGEARALAEHLRATLGASARSVLPGADTVLVHAAVGVSLAALLDTVSTAVTHRPASGVIEARSLSIPVTYDGADLAAVAALLNLSSDAVVSLHSGTTYEVSFLGFAPGFPYLDGLHPALGSVPRLDSPRASVPAGSVGLAAGKTCVYPTSSPGGWQLLGHTETVLFDPTNTESPATLTPGDEVRFVPARPTARTATGIL